ncbi:7-carboxy-7-deazaguanine synthase [Fibrobacter sp. UWB15]|uniref:7-carboxy-7-deazaguanine synthase QueE n=1 Tax=unclassified Fibrobacter TaxID=2634177 RepID=UPI0009143E0E|nr:MULTISPECIES: radical SAM protein [unclassified Fibrobacter]PWJ65104.1 7-carboxy-7-deazaguanine synthase [Fibrobacter sp. UWB6]SHG09013.1 7-carboxy-7-deazaguanine synthase [Fibrobacter sp. UWB8]SMG30814.1 7-carboxy-7-deazaguanine synthase [Fibrobacter sp. UWB15]
MKVCEIFRSIEGEGLRTGLPAVFIRLHGCNLRCSYCDSMYAVEGGDYKQMNVTQVLDAVKKFSGITHVTLTGGEPLIHQNVEDLLSQLSGNGYRVNIETNGTVPCKWHFPGLFYTMDWKCKSSGMSVKMKMENLETLGSEDVLKFVVGTIEDLEETETVVKSLAEKKDDMPHLFVSPVFGNLSNEEIVNWLLNSNIMVKNNVRFQVQLHKIIWDPERRGV